MTDTGDSDLSRLEYELTLVSRHYLATVQHRVNQHLDRSAYLILSRLELDNPLSLKELAEAFRLDVSTINRQVAALLKQGLVERVPDPDGGVARKVRAADEGIRMLHGDRATSRAAVAKVVENWSGVEIAEMHRTLAKFNRSIEDLEHNPWPRPEDR